MKKIICLLMCLILLISCVPAAMAASLTPEKVSGTWEMLKITNDKQVLDSAALKKMGAGMTFQFHADGTGVMTLTSPSQKETADLNWSIKSSKVKVLLYDGSAEIDLKLRSSYLVWSYKNEDGSSASLYLKKTSDSTGKTVTKAITSTGTYKLNNKKKTASLTIVANRNAASLTIPDTIKVNGKTYQVTEIAAKACANMKKLTTLTIGKNVKTIGANAFTGDSKLKKITFKGTVLGKVGNKAFSDVKPSGTVTCPKSKVSKYTKLLKKGGLPKKVKIKGK